MLTNFRSWKCDSLAAKSYGHTLDRSSVSRSVSSNQSWDIPVMLSMVVGSATPRADPLLRSLSELTILPPRPQRKHRYTISHNYVHVKLSKVQYHVQRSWLCFFKIPKKPENFMRNIMKKWSCGIRWKHFVLTSHNKKHDYLWKPSPLHIKSNLIKFMARFDGLHGIFS